MKILGIDPGIATTGYAVLHKEGQQLSPIDYGAIITRPTFCLSDRLKQLHDTFMTLLEKYQPTTLAIEELFFNVNVKSALVVGQARGVILLGACQKNMAAYHYTPSEVKMAVCGYGRADKRQVQEMVKRLLHLPKIPKPDDVADALAIAICHSHSVKLKSLT